MTNPRPSARPLARCASALLLALVALSACGGPDRPADVAPGTGSAPPPKLPPSMAGGGGGAGAAEPADGAGDASGAARDEIARGTKALEGGDLASAKAAFAAARSKAPDQAEPLYYLGVVAEKQGDLAAAETSYKDALAKKIDLEAAAMNLSALQLDAGRFDDAIATARGTLARRADSNALRLNLAVGLAGKGDQAGSTKEFEDVAKRTPKDPMVRLTYGHWLGVWKQTKPAIAQLAQAQSAAPDDVGVLAAVGEELRAIGAFPECIATLDRAITLKDAAELRTYRALCKLGAKDDPGATADLQAAIAKEPKFAPAHFYLGGRLAAQSKWKETAAEYEAYLKLAPKGPLAKQAADRAKVAREKAAGGKR